MQQFLICLHSDSIDFFFFISKKKTGKWLFIGRKNKYEEKNTKLGKPGENRIWCKSYWKLWRREGVWETVLNLWLRFKLCLNSSLYFVKSFCLGCILSLYNLCLFFSFEKCYAKEIWTTKNRAQINSGLFLVISFTVKPSIGLFWIYPLWISLFI